MVYEFKFPDVGEGIHEGEIVKWFVKEGDKIKADEPLGEIETDKAIVEMPSPKSGKILKIHVQAGGIIHVGETMVTILEEHETEADAKKHMEAKEKKDVPYTGSVVGFLEEAKDVKPIAVKKESKPIMQEKSILATPAVRNLAKQLNVDLNAIKGTGAEGIKLTFLPYIVKAVALCLKEHPYLNASLEEEEIVLKKYYNIGIAVDTEDGLIVPFFKGADAKDIKAIAKDIDKLANDARNRKINLMDLRGSSFSVSNLGSVGVEFFTPIINYPESAILGVGRIIEKPVVKSGKIEIRKMLPLSLTYDHRIVDGAQAARFMMDLMERLQLCEF